MDPIDKILANNIDFNIFDDSPLLDVDTNITICDGCQIGFATQGEYIQHAKKCELLFQKDRIICSICNDAKKKGYFRAHLDLHSGKV